MSVVDTPAAGGNRHVGQAMKRREDPRMITGRANYIDDMVLPGMLHMAVVRSAEAHATIVSIDLEGAKSSPGVVAVYTAADLAGDIQGPLAMVWDPPGVDINTPEHWPLKQGQVKHVGDPVAVVLADSKGQAMDAADLVIVDLDAKPAVVNPEKALEEGSPLVWEEFGTNKTHEWAVAGGDFEAAEAAAEVTVTQRVANHRTSGAPIEPRGSVAEARAESVTLYSSTQIPHIARFLLLDDSALGIALLSDAAYVGAMGSSRAQAKRRERLLDAGMDEELLDRLSAPIGLDLGAVGPEETALSIMAEVVAVRNGRSGGRLRDKQGGRIHEIGERAQPAEPAASPGGGRAQPAELAASPGAAGA